ncbi:MAG TPA: DUF998 domain-containing protein, partial [Nonomuraea sp.]|nr:DUF998 domain-containing protein [Nonomuraea sp.]
MTHVLARPDVANPSDLQISLDRVKARLEGQRDDVATATARQIEHIDRLAAQLHDSMVRVLAENDRGRLRRLADAVEVGSVLAGKMQAARTEPVLVSDLVAYAEAVRRWVGNPGGKLPLKTTPLRKDPEPVARSFESANMDAARRLVDVYQLQSELLRSIQDQARNNRQFRVREEELASLRRDLVTEFESLLVRSAYQELNAARAAAYEPTMSVPSVEQLRESLTNEKPVITATFLRLNRMIMERREGSFGIAGPRGVGKSTMIEHFAAPRVPWENSAPSGRPRLGVLVSAPVVYDAREFVLHLYAEICRKVAGVRAVEADHVKPITPRPTSPVRSAWLLVAGSAGLVFAYGLLWAAGRRRVSLGGTLLADIGAGVLALGVLALAWLASRARRSGVGLLMLMALYGGSIPALGLVFFLGNGAWGAAWPFVLGGVALLGVSVVLLRVGVPRTFRGRPTESPENPVVEAALERLREIRIQQSTTTERSIMLKVTGAPLPLGVDAGGKTGKTWQHRPKSYPELVGDLRSFLTTVQEHYELIIGIDELDKMAKADKVEDFLNDVKGIFGVKGCFFLVSVSEDAAAGFERRGVPFRDVFDSAFDEVISVPYLDFPTAREVLYGLIIGWTQPFVALCYVMSGGLARDLVRSTRELVEYRDQQDQIELTEAALGMCRRETGARLRAVRHELMRDPDVPQSIDLLNIIAEYVPNDATVATFHT